MGQLLAVAGAGVGENLPHELSGTAADVALMVHEELIEELERLLLAGGGHIGAVLVQEPQVRADGGRGALPPRLFEKQVEGLLGGDGVHQAHVALEGHPLERLPRLPGGEQRRIPVGHGLQGGIGEVGAHAVGLEKSLEVPELTVHRLIPPLLLGRHVGQLGEDHIPALRKGVDAHDLFAVDPRPPDAEVGIDEQEGFHGQILKFQIPGGVVGGHVADFGEACLFQPRPGEVIVEVGDAF